MHGDCTKSANHELVPANIYLFKVTIETLEKGVKYFHQNDVSGVFIVHFEHLFSKVSIVDFEQVNVSCDMRVFITKIITKIKINL